MHTFFIIDDIIILIGKYETSFGPLYLKSLDMFLLVENSEIAYFLSLSIAQSLITYE